MSGVTVPTMIMSMSLAVRPAAAIALFAASAAMSLVTIPGSAIRLSRMPVRSMIHSFDVSTIFSRSWFVRMVGGKKWPVPRMREAGGIMGVSLQRGRELIN